MYPTLCLHVSRSGLLHGSFFVLLRAYYFWVPFNLSQHETTKILVWGPRKKCGSALLCHHTVYFRKQGLECKILQTNPLSECCSDFGLYTCKWGQKYSFESCMKIGHCIFLKIDILGQNWAWGRFLRFCAGFFTYTVFVHNDGGSLKFDPLKKFEHLSEAVCPQRSLER